MSRGWLGSRVDETPEALRARLQARVAGLQDGPELPAELMAAAIELLESVHARLESRDAAFDLLVADGLLTLACEAAALWDPGHLEERCRAMGPSGELGRVARSWAERS